MYTTITQSLLKNKQFTLTNNQSNKQLKNKIMFHDNIITIPSINQSMSCSM